jgi:Polyketide cyclase / dehydrase and lipid transport
MKAGRLFIFFILAVLLTTAVLSFSLPSHQKIVRTIVIQNTAEAIYQQLSKLEHFHRFSTWSRQDSSAVYTFTGTDGTVGASSSWKGSPLISGEGKITITDLQPNRSVEHQLEFTKPRKGKARSVFTLTETNKATTTVSWTFLLATPRPWNIFNLFYSMEKEMGKDFEDGLQLLKLAMEQNP